MCADLGSRKIRDELSAMEVLAVSPIATLVVPRIWAAVFVAMLLDGFVSVAGIAGGYFFNVISQGFGTMPSYASQVPPRDRWAIIAHIRQLQQSRQEAE